MAHGQVRDLLVFYSISFTKCQHAREVFRTAHTQCDDRKEVCTDDPQWNSIKVACFSITNGFPGELAECRDELHGPVPNSDRFAFWRVTMFSAEIINRAEHIYFIRIGYRHQYVCVKLHYCLGVTLNPAAWMP
ncbi:hypothetical protein D1AOALGA4SA_1786 [Olavius algarvensis Delta 1 endosymbiont]|nr:hypothetical protein D1AOALGA4SA_1786 [Olavius algarvensis Delta 1 endosymbiont]